MPPTMNRRRLSRGVPPQSQARAVNCLACEWRKASHVGLKSLVDATDNPELARYTGFLHGVQDDFLITAQFVMGREVGLITVPLREVEGFLDSVVQYLNSFIEAAQNSVPELPDDEQDGEDDEEGEDGEEEEASEED